MTEKIISASLGTRKRSAVINCHGLDGAGCGTISSFCCVGYIFYRNWNHITGLMEDTV